MNVIGTATCIMAIAKQAECVQVCAVLCRVRSIRRIWASRPGCRRVATCLKRWPRARARVCAHSPRGLHEYRAGQTGLLRLTWDNGDRTILVNPNVGGITLGWNLNSTAEDDLYSAIEGTAMHTRVIFDRMREYGVPVRRVIHGGGIPQKNAVLNQVYANGAERARVGARVADHQFGECDLRVCRVW